MKLDARFAKAFSEFNKHDDLRFDQCVARKLQPWFTRFPPTPRVAGDSPPSQQMTTLKGGGRAARGELGWRARKRKRMRPIPCLEANKYC